MVLIRWAEADRDTLSAVLPDALVVIPIGATEQHGPHLATGTDALLAATTAERAAERAAATASRPLVLTPTLAFGASDHHLPFGGTLSLTPETLLAVLLELLRSVAMAGGRRVVLVNGHGGNVGSCQAAAAAAASRHDLAVGYLDYWRVVGVSPGHAGKFETSLVAAVEPGWVQVPTVRDAMPEVPSVEDVELYDAATWAAIDGYTDRPEAVDGAAGERQLAEIVDALAARFVELAVVLGGLR